MTKLIFHLRICAPFFLLLAIALNTSAHANLVPADGLTAYWTFDGTFDNSPPASGNASPKEPANLDLEQQDGVTFDSGGLFGKAARFDGTDDFLQIKDGGGKVVDDEPLPDTTISVWFKADRAPTGSERFFIYETSPSFTLSLGLRAGTSAGNTRVQLFTDDPLAPDPNIAVEVPNSIIAGQWVHVATTISLEDKSFSVIVNGGDAHGGVSASGSLNVSGLATFNDFHIGTYRGANARFFPGLIDEFAIWNRKLTEAELFSLSTIAVTTATDENNDSTGNGVSLRDAINHAPSGATITFAPALNGETITLTQGQLLIDESLTIDASALPDGLTIDANGEETGHRVMEIAAGHTVALHSLTLTGGKATGSFPNNRGGGIYNRGTLTLDWSTLSGNSAAFGGGIYNRGTLTLTQSTLSGNYAADNGGGIYIDGTLTLDQSTLSGNSAANGGGIYNTDTLTLTQSTLSGNSAADDGGGISNFGTLTLTNSIVAGNTAPSGANIEGTPDGASQSHTTGDPLLAPLGDYGGPTQTMPPLAGSPAIDAADIDDPGGTDQRGFPRFVGGALDIGSVEYQGRADLSRFWELDTDGDGKPYGLEFAIGTNPLVPDAGAPGMLTSPTFANPGEARMVFGVNPAAEADVIWRLKRSPDLSPGSFTEIFRFEGPSGMEHSVPAAVEATSGPTSITVLDKAPPEDRAFYILEVEPAAP
ncbi:MAG: hypothetical protein GVY36_05415 [Verrucomicrobia bacterium]|nr:hypothetical protein [Verrucomicrobiota bacterium]